MLFCIISLDIDCLPFIFAVVPQTELNSREGAWERLCTERDPVVLSMLLWSWLEQLKEPVITKEDVETLSGNRLNPEHALNSLDKVPKNMKRCPSRSGSLNEYFFLFS